MEKGLSAGVFPKVGLLIECEGSEEWGLAGGQGYLHSQVWEEMEDHIRPVAAPHLHPLLRSLNTMNTLPSPRLQVACFLPCEGW